MFFFVKYLFKKYKLKKKYLVSNQIKGSEKHSEVRNSFKKIIKTKTLQFQMIFTQWDDFLTLYRKKKQL